MEDKALAKVEAFRARYLALTSDKNFDRQIWLHLNILSASADNGKASFSIKIPATFSNHFGTVHGGAMATLFDGLTSAALALLSQKHFWDGKEVSRDLQCRFFKPVPIDELIKADCEVVHAGSRLATVRCQLRRQSDHTLFAECVHEKFYPVPQSKL